MGNIMVLKILGYSVCHGGSNIIKRTHFDLGPLTEAILIVVIFEQLCSELKKKKYTFLNNA